MMRQRGLLPPGAEHGNSIAATAHVDGSPMLGSMVIFVGIADAVKAQDELNSMARPTQPRAANPAAMVRICRGSRICL